MIGFSEVKDFVKPSTQKSNGLGKIGIQVNTCAVALISTKEFVHHAITPPFATPN